MNNRVSFAQHVQIKSFGNEKIEKKALGKKVLKKGFFAAIQKMFNDGKNIDGQTRI